jgi:hypothetical protein
MRQVKMLYQHFILYPPLAKQAWRATGRNVYPVFSEHFFRMFLFQAKKFCARLAYALF